MSRDSVPKNSASIANRVFKKLRVKTRETCVRSSFPPPAWIVAAAFFSPNLFTYQLVEYSGEMLCEMTWTKAFGESSSPSDYILAASILFTYFPVMVLVLFYSIILIKLKTQAHPGEQSANTQQQRNKRNRNVLHMSIAIVLVFILLVTLFH